MSVCKIIFFIYCRRCPLNMYVDIFIFRVGVVYNFKATFVALFPLLSIAFEMFINMRSDVSI